MTDIVATGFEMEVLCEEAIYDVNGLNCFRPSLVFRLLIFMTE